MQTKLITMEMSLLAPPDEMCVDEMCADEMCADEMCADELGTVVVGGVRMLRSAGLRSHIETQLTAQGEPLRWAITAIDRTRQMAAVEAVVTVAS